MCVCIYIYIHIYIYAYIDRYSLPSRRNALGAPQPLECGGVLRVKLRRRRARAGHLGVPLAHERLQHVELPIGLGLLLKRETGCC